MYKSDSFFDSDQREAISLDDSQFRMQKVYPYINHMYNMLMNGVDVVDQLVASYDRQHRYPNWKRQAYKTSWSLYCQIAYQMYKFKQSKDNQQAMTHFQFKQNVALGLLPRRSERIEFSSSPMTDFPELTPEYIVHPFIKMPKRSHCRIMIPNTDVKSIRKFPMVQCRRKTWKACTKCPFEDIRFTYMCNEHYKSHLPNDIQ